VGDSFLNHVRLNSAERSKLLSRLDETPTGQRGRDRRRYRRWEYRMSDIAVLVQHPGGGTGRYLVCARNISAGGISFIHGGYLHPGSECRVVLPRRDGLPLAVSGTIVHCRYVESSFHEIGIQFSQEIDPASVLQPSEGEAVEMGDRTQELPALEGQMLVVDESPSDRRLMTHQLSATGLDLTMVETTGAALDALRRRDFQLVLCDLNLEDDAVRMIKKIRKTDYKGPIIVITAESSAARLGEARAAGANEIIGKPYNPIYLASLLAEWLEAPPVDHPIYSSVEEKPGMAELIADFIEQTQREAHQLEKALAGGEVSGVRELCLGLAGSGTGYGFDSLTEAARNALTALDTSQSRKDIEGPLRRLISVCQRLRCGSSVRPMRDRFQRQPEAVQKG
jgi:CheY-like chemotaxis protein